MLFVSTHPSFKSFALVQPGCHPTPKGSAERQHSKKWGSSLASFKGPACPGGKIAILWKNNGDIMVLWKIMVILW